MSIARTSTYRVLLRAFLTTTKNRCCCAFEKVVAAELLLLLQTRWATMLRRSV
jgi:hypothetical protein